MEDRKNSEMTPMVRQYMDIKKEHQDKVLFFRLGDFYEMFNDDAIEVSKLLNLTLTHRGTMPMCGIPYHAARNYLKRLLEYGKKVAVCEQFITDEKKLAERTVTQIFTPATVVDDEYIDSLSSQYIVSVYRDRKGLYCAWCDITTGDFKVTELKVDKSYSELENLLYKIECKEILAQDDVYFSEKEFRRILDSRGAMISKLPSWYFSLREGRKAVEKQFGQSALRLIGMDEKDSALCAVGSLLDYINENARTALPQLRYIERVTDSSFMILNTATIRNLELVRNMQDNSEKYTLFSSINYTRTPSGARFLRSAILHPLVEKAGIEERQKWVYLLYSERDENERVRKCLKEISDLERLSVKAEMKRLTPRDLIALSESISSFLTLVEKRNDYLTLVENNSFDFPHLLSFASAVIRGINRECTNINNEGTIINDGYDESLDELRHISSSGSTLLDEYLERIRKETDITNLKVGENRIIGSYIEVSRGQLDKVPSYFIRRQTLVGGERFTTEELGRIQEKIYTSREEEAKREKAVFNAFVSEAFDLSSDIERMGRVVTLLDFYSSAAECALEKNYVKPHIVEEGDIEITDGRHPVVEDYTENYVPNSFSSKESRFSLVTGPNMAGKSTYLREIALITLLSHIGYFVPATSAVIPVTDKIFCRVGASDNLSKGESTFLVEMSESSQILLSLTPRSLVIMDEIGRGTSTEDGMSIAWAIMNYLRASNAITLFSTHYHELTQLDTSGIQLLHMAVLEEKNTITFLRKAEKGVATSSYGIHVAKIAGLPRQIINEANSFMKKHFADYSSLSSEDGNLFTSDARDITLSDEIIEEISDFDTDSSTPLEALMFISRLKEKIREDK